MDFVNPFRTVRNKVAHPALDDSTVYRVVSTEVDKDTMVTTPVFEEVDSQKEIQACKELCGLEYMKKLLASGQISQEDLQDNAGETFDTTLVPETVHEAKAKAEEINTEVAKTMKAVGAEEGESYTAKQVEKMIETAVKAAMSASAPATPAATPEGGDK